MAFVHAFNEVYNNNKKGIQDRQTHLNAGVAKLNEAKELVADLNSKAAEQSRVLAEKQEEADQSLKEITFTMQVRDATIMNIVIKIYHSYFCITKYDLTYRVRVTRNQRWRR
jgi:hypothetical protein